LPVHFKLYYFIRYLSADKLYISSSGLSAIPARAQDNDLLKEQPIPAYNKGHSKPFSELVSAVLVLTPALCPGVNTAKRPVLGISSSVNSCKSEPIDEDVNRGHSCNLTHIISNIVHNSIEFYIYRPRPGTNTAKCLSRPILGGFKLVFCQ